MVTITISKAPGTQCTLESVVSNASLLIVEATIVQT